MIKYVRDVKVAKVKVKEDNVIFSDEVKQKTTQRIRFHLNQMASLIQNVGEASAEEEYQEVKKELVDIVIDKTISLMTKDVRLDIKEVPPIKLEREIPYVIPDTDDRDGVLIDEELEDNVKSRLSDLDNFKFSGVSRFDEFVEKCSKMKKSKHLNLIDDPKEAQEAISTDITEDVFNGKKLDKSQCKNNEDNLNIAHDKPTAEERVKSMDTKKIEETVKKNRIERKKKRGQYLTGKMSEMMVMDRALSPDEVSKLSSPHHPQSHGEGEYAVEKLEALIRKQEYKDFEDFKNNTGIYKKDKDSEFEKRSAASKKGWETRRKNADKK